LRPVMRRAPHVADRGSPGRPRPGVAARAFARHKQSPRTVCVRAQRLRAMALP
jgi:hypothetical protein